MYIFIYYTYIYIYVYVYTYINIYHHDIDIPFHFCSQSMLWAAHLVSPGDPGGTTMGALSYLSLCKKKWEQYWIMVIDR